MMHRSIFWTLFGLIGAVMLVVVLTSGVSAARMFGATLFCLLAPGYGWARRFSPNDRGDTLAMRLVISLCATIGVGTAMAVSGWWSPHAGFILLALIAMAGFHPWRGHAPGHAHRKDVKSSAFPKRRRPAGKFFNESRRPRSSTPKHAAIAVPYWQWAKTFPRSQSRPMND